MQQPGLTVTYRSEPDHVLCLDGELDIGTAPVLRDAFLNLLREDDATDLQVDASGVTFVDSSGLAVLLMGARRWEAAERRFVLQRPSQAVQRILDLTGVRRAFEIGD